MPEDRIRGSANIPLSPDGEKQVTELGQRIRALGGFDRVHTPDIGRAQSTARALGAPIITDHNLRDMSYGGFEGMKSSEAFPYINKFITQLPDEPVPGTSQFSNEEGHSFNDYKRRLLGSIYKVMQDHDPATKTGIVLNRRSLKTIEGWLSMGGTPDFQTDADVVTHKESPSPASVHRLEKVNGRWQLHPYDLEKQDRIDPGIYLIRHGLTAWNGETLDAPNSTKVPH